MKVLLFRDFLEDQRESMDLYAYHIRQSVEKFCPQTLEMSEYLPRTASWLANKNGMRFSRYVIYPLQTLGKHADIYHIVDQAYGHLLNVLPANRTVITVHDIISLIRWQGCIPHLDRGTRPYLVEYSFKTLHKAAHIIAVSENTKKTLIQYLNIPPEKISVVYSGIDPIYYEYSEQKKLDAKVRIFGDVGDDFRILVTGVGYQKNHVASLDVLKSLVLRGVENVRIVKIGHITDTWNFLVRERNLEEYVINFGFFPREKMVDLFNAVDLLLYPSLYEGFGWPPLEAMSCGVPAVTSNTASLPEVVGMLPTQFDPYDIESMSNVIQKISVSSEFQKELRSMGKEILKKFSWQKTTDSLVRIYNKVYQSSI